MNKPISLRTAWPYALIAFILILGPLLLAWTATPSGYVFSGTLINPNDFCQYTAAMRQGADGKWLYHFNFSPESWQPQLMYSLYLVSGKIFPGTWEYTVQAGILRAIALSLTLLIYGMWVRQIFPDAPNKQWSTWLLLVFGGGLGWILWPLANLAGYPDSTYLFPDITDSSWTLALIGANAPHYLFGLFFETLFFLLFWRITEGANFKWAWAGSITAVLLGLVYVYNSIVIFAVVGLYLGWHAWENRRIDRALWLKGGLILFHVFVILFYYGVWVNHDPTWAQFAKSPVNRVIPPEWYTLLWGTGIVGFLAVFGIRHWWIEKRNRLLIVWMIANLLAIYLPILPISGRFLLGLWVPLATLAAHGLEEVVLPRLNRSTETNKFGRSMQITPESLRRMILIVSMPSILFVTLSFIKNIGAYRDFPYYFPQSELSAMKWLAETTDPKTDLVLSYYPVGNCFPVLSDTHVFMGNFFLTVNYDEKLKQVEQFWDVNTSDDWRKDLIEKWNVTYIYQGVYENAISTGHITPPGEMVYDQAGVKIYQITDSMP